MFKIILVLALAGASLHAAAIPKITVGSMYDFIESDKSTLLKRIRNSGDDTGYVRVDVSEVSYLPNGGKLEKKIDATAAASGKVDGLIFTPSRMIIPANGMQTGRLVVVGKRDKERYYRVRYIPVMPKDQYEFGQSKKQYDEYKKSLNAGVSILTGYGAMVIVRPENVVFNTDIAQRDNKIIITNKGNSSIKLEGIKLCQGGKCGDASSVILMPGKQHNLKQESQKNWQFTLLEGSKKTPKKFG